MSKHLQITTIDQSLRLFYNYLNGNIATKDVNGTKHSGFVLNIANPSETQKMGVGATSLALSIYGSLLEIDNRHTLEMEQYLLSKRLVNGSWTISPLVKSNLSLIYTTCYALQSFARSDFHKNFRIMDEGLKWLLQNVNSDGGWGLVQETPTHVHPTSEVLFLFSLCKGYVDHQIILKAKNILIDMQADNTYWLDDHGAPSIFLTALAYKAIMSVGDFHFELTKTKDWLEKNLAKSPCKEDITYYIPVEGQHFLEPVTCFTRSVVFESLTTNKFLSYNSIIEKEAKYILERQNKLGFWVCSGSPEVPTYLNYHIFIGLKNYADYLQRRPRNPLLVISVDYFKKFPTSTSLILLFSIIGMYFLVMNLASFLPLAAEYIKKLNAFFENLSGLANFFGITGISLGVILIYILKYLRDKKE